MPAPTVKVEIAFASAPLATSPTWTDVTAYAMEFSIRRGRSFEQDVVSAGTASVLLDNRSRRFDPAYTSGAYYPNVVPMKRVRISGIYNAVTYPLFVGYVEEWRQEISQNGQDINCRIQLVDALTVLNTYQITLSSPEEWVEGRVGRILDTVGWPAADRTLAESRSRVPEKLVENVTALSHLQAVVGADNGLIFVGPDGKIVFQDRHYRVRLPITSLGTFGISGGQIPFVDMEPVYTGGRILNDVRATREGGIEQIITDPTSITSYTRRTQSITGLQLVADAFARAQAEYLVYRYKDPSFRIERLTIDGHANPSSGWPAVLQANISSRLTVVRAYVTGSSYTQVSDVEGVERSWSAVGAEWKTQLNISPADTVQYWQLGDSTYGVLDSTTRLGY